MVKLKWKTIDLSADGTPERRSVYGGALVHVAIGKSLGSSLASP